MGEGKGTFGELVRILPEGWEQKAKELGALQRAREVKTAKDLLQLIFLYLTEGKSFGNTSALLKLSTGYSLTKKAIYTRVCNSGEWLRWLCENLCRQNQIVVEKPAWLEQKAVYLVDASDESVWGSCKADYRLHYAVNLFDLSMKEMYLTNAKTGEKLSNFQRFGTDDLVLADRAYGTIQGIEHLKGSGSDFILRYRTNGFNLYECDEKDTEYNQVEVTDYFKGLNPGESASISLYYRTKADHRIYEYKPIQICAVRKTAEAEQKGVEHLKDMNRMKSHGKPPSAAQLANNRYIITVTSLGEVDAALILQLYRFRWQIELVFKRLKSLFHYNEIPSKLDTSARAWFYGKLLLAAFCETWVNKGRFSPSAGKISG